MSHSSKAALTFAGSLGISQIVAIGFSPILQEALARGATDIVAVPLCADPFEQASFFPHENFSYIILGENPDWKFSGASICGILAESRKIGLEICKPGSMNNVQDFSDNSLILVLDSGESSSSIDVRRIKYSTSANVNPEGVLGDSVFSKLEDKRTEKIAGTPSDITSTISRKLRRLVRTS